jgi:hypothetical protein
MIHLFGKEDGLYEVQHENGHEKGEKTITRTAT